MAEPQKLLEWQTLQGTPIEVDGVRVIPESQSLSLRLPFFRFVWNRPVAITVERLGQSERFPIVDVTRVVQVVIAGIVLGFALAVGLSKGRKEKKSGR